jgi:hypothetical protein
MDAGTQHSAVMTGLSPSKRYYYSYGDKAWGMSAVTHFVSPPLPGPDTPVSLLAVADMGQVCM